MRAWAVAAALPVLAMAGHAAACTALPGAEAALSRPGLRYLLVGEIHGSAETPVAFADLVCAAAATGRPVVVALEQSMDGQAALETYLVSSGGAAAEQTVMEALYWHAPVRDGRSSVASLELLRTLHRFKAEGRIMTVQTILGRGDGSPADHERKMADGLEAAAARAPNALVVGLMGNFHAMKGQRPGRDGVTYRLAADLLPPDATVSLYVISAGGAAWFCSQSECMARPLKGVPVDKPRGVSLEAPGFDGYDGILSIGGPMTASPPAMPLP